MTGVFLDDKENMAPESANTAARARGDDGGGDGAEQTAKTHYMGKQAQLLTPGEAVSTFFDVRSNEKERLKAIKRLRHDPRSAELWIEVFKGVPPGTKWFVKSRMVRRAIALMGKLEQYFNTPSYVQIWILHAKTQGTTMDTRKMFNTMKNDRIGERLAMFYEEFAAFEYSLGNIAASDEILELGVQRKAYGHEEMREIHAHIITGQLASTAFFLKSSSSSVVKEEDKLFVSREIPDPRGIPVIKQEVIEMPNDTLAARGFSSVKREVTQTPHEPPAGHDISTPRSGSRSILSASTAITTPVGAVKASAAGASTVSKIPRNDGSSVLTTPSFARTSAKSQSTTRKNSVGSSRLRTFASLGGPPLRVVASANQDDGNSDDEDDDGMQSPVHRKETKPLPPQSSQAPDKPVKKISADDISYIKAWGHERPAGTAESASSATAAVTSRIPPPTQKQPRSGSAFVAGFGTDSRQHDQLQLPSPKRLQIDAGVPLSNRGVENSPHSVSSVSSSSSPPLLSGDAKIKTDPFGSLTSKVVVNGLTYIKLEQIGSGGSSKVYRMLGPDLKIYALKKIKLKRLDEKSIEQYTNEIQLLKRLQGNPHIIRLVAAEQDLQQRQINVVMEHGEIDLSDRLRDLKDGMDENFLRVIWTQMLQAVHAIHRERIIHGDLKPANFLFVNGALKLIDFGIAKAISNDTTNIERDSQVGTVNYMSPEAIQGNTTPNGQRNSHGKMKVGRASDIWSLGCILYQIVYGKPPFADVHSIIEKFRCIIDPSIPIQFPPLNNKDLEDVIRSCLQRDHRARPHIDGEDGLLQHPFLRSSNGGGDSRPIVTLNNASQVLMELGDILRSHGADVTSVSTFVSLGRDGLQRAARRRFASPRIGYNTQERRTEI